MLCSLAGLFRPKCLDAAVSSVAAQTAIQKTKLHQLSPCQLTKMSRRSIPTDFSKLKHPIVCIKHFEEACIIRVDRIIVKGELKEYPRERVKLCENAVPTIFPNAPSYCTKRAPKVKRLGDIEEEQMQQAIR